MKNFVKSQGKDMSDEEAKEKAMEIVDNSVANKTGRIEKESEE
jgi:hypothetical protein